MGYYDKARECLEQGLVALSELGDIVEPRKVLFLYFWHSMVAKKKPLRCSKKLPESWRRAMTKKG